MLSLCKFGKTLCAFQKSTLQSKGFISQINQFRCLFSARELGIEGYEKGRRDAENFVTDPYKYKRKFHLDFGNEPDFPKFENGLKRLLFVMEKDDNDINILKDALYTLIRKQKEHSGYKYIFGPVIMRVLYYLNLPIVAIEFLDDKLIGQLFTEITGHQVLLDLLYENKMYETLLRVRESRPFESKYIDALVLAAYYRINTPEALDKAFDYWKKMEEIQVKHPFRKSLTFVAGMAVKHNRPEIALEVLECIFKDFHVTVRQIKLLAWCQLGRFGKITDMFRTIIKRHKELNRNDEYTSLEVLDKIEKSLDQNGPELKKFLALRKEIKSLGLITEETLDDMLCAPFPVKLQSNQYHRNK
ncbi:uncharacterized protein LOC116343877 [Contarinia nasturtii]|uniref:uncharacterized protein LOC116343877 n=1 Tax=Contarinia nasturtii TaxID=265458 RepID=UPI0012D48635|nr:uncharacterized protein LOC116343877 [Contarinia nasturtii]XP_031628028.1 uncharacterized protein LOC116343877 [Contarinia nasturtii]